MVELSSGLSLPFFSLTEAYTLLVPSVLLGSLLEKLVLKTGSPTQALLGTSTLSTIGDLYFGAGGLNAGIDFCNSKFLSESISVIFRLRNLPSF